MNAETLIKKLSNYYEVTTLTELANKLKTTQSTISGWKSRNAIGSIIDKVLEIDENALYFVFKVDSKIETTVSEELLFNSIKFRISSRINEDFNNFQNELILFSEILSKIVSVYTREDLIQKIKSFNLHLCKKVFLEKHKNNLLSLVYNFDILETQFIINNMNKFRDLIELNIKRN